MIAINRTMDQHSLEITRDAKHVGYVQWHPEREPRIVLSTAFEFLTMSEVSAVQSAYEAHRELARKLKEKFERKTTPEPETGPESGPGR